MYGIPLDADMSEDPLCIDQPSVQSLGALLELICVNLKQDRLKTDQDDLPIQIVFHGATSLMLFFHGKLALPL